MSLRYVRKKVLLWFQNLLEEGLMIWPKHVCSAAVSKDKGSSPKLQHISTFLAQVTWDKKEEKF
jgi:hypothetical protein